MEELVDKCWKEFQKIRTPQGFDFKSYFKGKTPEEAYEDYKNLASKYINLVYYMKGYDYGEEIDKEGPIHKKNLQTLRRLYEKANMMEKYIKNNTNRKYAFVDLGILNTSEHENESAADYYNGSDREQKVVWMPSEKFLEMAYQLKYLEDIDLHSIGYSHNRLKTGRIAPPSLRFNYNGAEQMFEVDHHQGRHRNYANMLLNEENEIPVIISFPKENISQFNNFRRGLKNGYPTKALVIPENYTKTDEELSSNVYDRYSESPPSDELYQRLRKPKKYTLQDEKNTPRGMSPRKASQRAIIYPKLYPDGEEMPVEEITPEHFETAFNEDKTMKKAWKSFENADIKISDRDYSYYDPDVNIIYLHGSDLNIDNGGVDITDLINHENQHAVQVQNAIHEPPRKQSYKRRIEQIYNKYLDAKLRGEVPIMERDAMFAEKDPKKNKNYNLLTPEQKKKMDSALDNTEPD
jgi:hypothetical protein